MLVIRGMWHEALRRVGCRVQECRSRSLMACCLPGCNRAHRVEMLLECWCCCCTFTVGRECGWCAVDNTIFDLETVTPDAVRKYQLSDEELQAHFKVWPNFVANAGAGIAVGAAASEKAKKVGVCLFAWCVRVYFVFVWVCVVVVVVVLVFVWEVHPVTVLWRTPRQYTCPACLTVGISFAAVDFNRGATWRSRKPKCRVSKCGLDLICDCIFCVARCLGVQTSFLDSEMSKKVQIATSKFNKRPLREIVDAIESFDVDGIGGYEVVKALVDLNCYEQVTITPAKGASASRAQLRPHRWLWLIDSACTQFIMVAYDWAGHGSRHTTAPLAA